VQAFFRVGDELRSFAPIFHDTAAEAEESRQEIVATLWHMADHDLDVRVEKIERALADAEEQRLTKANRPIPPN
jgi:hypothetical protein